MMRRITVLGSVAVRRVPGAHRPVGCTFSSGSSIWHSALLLLGRGARSGLQTAACHTASRSADAMFGLTGLQQSWRDIKRGRPVHFREQSKEDPLGADILANQRAIAIFDSAEEVRPRHAALPMPTQLGLTCRFHTGSPPRMRSTEAKHHFMPLRRRCDATSGLGFAGRSSCMAEYADGAGAPKSRIGIRRTRVPSGRTSGRSMQRGSKGSSSCLTRMRLRRAGCGWRTATFAERTATSWTCAASAPAPSIASLRTDLPAIATLDHDAISTP
jgi:hypothetical protein